MTIYDNSGVLVVSKRIPPIEQTAITGLFGIMQPLNSSFAAGRYWVYYSYLVSTTQRCAVDSFEILAGGNSGGQVISLAFLDRPDADWMVGQLDSGASIVARGPRT